MSRLRSTDIFIALAYPRKGYFYPERSYRNVLEVSAEDISFGNGIERSRSDRMIEDIGGSIEVVSAKKMDFSSIPPKWIILAARGKRIALYNTKRASMPV